MTFVFNTLLATIIVLSPYADGFYFYVHDDLSHYSEGLASFREQRRFSSFSVYFLSRQSIGLVLITC